MLAEKVPSSPLVGLATRRSERFLAKRTQRHVWLGCGSDGPAVSSRPLKKSLASGLVV